MYESQREPIGFLEAVALFFSRYTDFGGRSRRSEYWWVMLFNVIVSFVLAMLPNSLAFLSGLWSLAILVPSLAICIRRLHDVGKSGWWYLFILIPLVGGIILLVQFCKDSTEDNQWGPNPKA